MEDRIQVNGIWYVREDQTEKNEPLLINDEDLTFSRKCTFENDNCLFEFEVLENDYDELIMPSLQYCNKRVKDSKVIHIADNENWFIRIINNEPLAFDDLDGEIDLTEDRQLLRQFLIKLQKKGWVNDEL